MSQSSFVVTTQAPRSKTQRGKARPKTSVVQGTNLRSLANPNTKVFTIQQTLATFILQQAGAVEQDFAGGAAPLLAPTLSLLDQVSTLTSLFDQYRIAKVDAIFRPLYGPANFSAAVGDIPGALYVVIDYDDTTALTIAQLRQYTSLVTSEFEQIRVSYVPHVANAVYSGVFTSFGNLTSPWIDCNSTSVVHYGLKAAIGSGFGAGQGNLQKWRVDVTLTCQFRNVR